MRCQSCGNDFEDAGGATCPYCSGGSATTGVSRSVRLSSADPGEQTPPHQPPAPEPDGPPWERQRSLSALLDTLKGVLIEPGETFRYASRTAGLGPALLFGLILGLAGSWISIFWQYFLGAAFGGGLGSSQLASELPPELADLLNFGGPMMLLIGLAMAPVLLLIGMFLWSAVVHLMLLLLGGASHGYEATFRTIAYCSGATALFQAVPFCGSWIGGIWSLVAQILCLKEMHNISGGKATAAVLLPLVLCCCSGLALTMAIGMLVGANMGGGF